jgi:acyl-CoA thioester hydrolase
VHVIRVLLRDLDGLGHVNHAVYLSYLEAARTQYYCERRGVTRIEQFDFILGSLSCTYHAPAYFHEALAIALWPTRIGTKSWTLGYEIREQRSNRLVARAETTQVHFDYRAGRSVAIPDEWRAVLERDRAAMSAASQESAGS